jgi:hypothetical protein
LAWTLPRSARWLAAALLALSAAARAACPGPATVDLLERFIPADCEVCWSTGIAPAGKPFVLDWIVPGARGDEAPLSAAALAEAGTRAGAMAADSTLQRRHALAPLQGLSLRVRAGPAWYGYIGLQFGVQREGSPLPDAAVGYLALVETLRAGEEGTPVERRLVRALAGPLALDDGARASGGHLLALRLPAGAKAERLGAVGWIEAPSGSVIALARADAPECPAAP